MLPSVPNCCGGTGHETSPPATFCIWPQALPRRRRCRVTRGRKPIRCDRCAIVVGFPAGATPDIIARLDGPMACRSGSASQFVIENRPGAGRKHRHRSRRQGDP